MDNLSFEIKKFKLKIKVSINDTADNLMQILKEYIVFEVK